MIESSPSTKAHDVGLRDVVCALVVALLAGILYIATLQPDLGGPEDTPKFQFLGYVFGTAHPPGYPLYSMLSGAFVHLVPIGPVAYRANLFSAVMAALACGTVFLIARLLGASRWTAGCAALGLASGASFWRSAVFAEVYSLAAATAGLSLMLLLVWGDRLRPVWLLGAIAATAAAFGNHLTIVGVVPAYIVYVLVRDRKALTVRVVALATVFVLLGFAQYGFIVLRTKQHALYLESRANSFSELVEIVTAQRFAEQRFAYSLRTLLTVQLPVVTETMEEDLRLGGLVLVVIGIVAAVRRKRGGALLTLGAGLGMLWMVVNLGGDVKGFITPIMVFVWPFAAVGADGVCRAIAALSRRRIAGLIAGGVAAAALPIVNVSANYKEADQSRMRENAEFFRALHAQLPDGAGVVTEDYFYDMSFYYYRVTREAPGGKRLFPVPFDAPIVRETAADAPGLRLCRGRDVLCRRGTSVRSDCDRGVAAQRVARAAPEGDRACRRHLVLRRSRRPDGGRPSERAAGRARPEFRELRRGRGSARRDLDEGLPRRDAGGRSADPRRAASILRRHAARDRGRAGGPGGARRADRRRHAERARARRLLARRNADAGDGLSRSWSMACPVSRCRLSAHRGNALRDRDEGHVGGRQPGAVHRQCRHDAAAEGHRGPGDALHRRAADRARGRGDSRRWRCPDAEPAARGRRRIAVDQRADAIRRTSNRVPPRAGSARSRARWRG